jgi:four helix bundle protein
MASRHNFRKLKVWELGMDVVDLIYDFTATLPEDERFNLKSQSNRCAVSIPANIAEGSGALSDRDFARYAGIGLSSSYELETHLLICQRRKLGDQELLIHALDLLHQEQKMIASFQNQLRSRFKDITTKLLGWLF